MALIIDGILNGKLPWELVLIGALIAVVLELAGVSSLPFAVGVYLPIQTSTPIFIGGHGPLVRRQDQAARRDEAETSPGVLLELRLHCRRVDCRRVDRASCRSHPTSHDWLNVGSYRVLARRPLERQPTGPRRWPPSALLIVRAGDGRPAGVCSRTAPAARSGTAGNK